MPKNVARLVWTVTFGKPFGVGADDFATERLCVLAPDAVMAGVCALAVKKRKPEFDEDIYITKIKLDLELDDVQ